eukprot:XP_001692646.1 predicted protein [Chlamydomonas reinhardtii]
MSVGEFTASNIAMDMDEKEKAKGSIVDMAKLTADIAAQKEIAAKASPRLGLLGSWTDINSICKCVRAWGQRAQAIEGLLNLEKSSRLAEDVTATKACCSAILELCYDARDWRGLEENVMLLTKRRSQLKQAVQATVRQAMSYIDAIPAEDKDTRVSLIKTLQAVTEGKETFGAMAKTEKIAFILEQGTPALPELKLRYYQLLIRYHVHNHNYLEVTRCYRSLYEAHLEGGAPADTYLPVLKAVVWYLCLAPAYSTKDGSASDRATLLQATVSALLGTFTNTEVIRWTAFEAAYGPEVAAEAGPGGVFADSKRSEDLKLRVVEHNVLVAAKYYSRLRTARLAAILSLTPEQMEKHVSDLVVAKAITAKIDRPAGVITFAAPPSAEQQLNGWAGNIAAVARM